MLAWMFTWGEVYQLMGSITEDHKIRAQHSHPVSRLNMRGKKHKEAQGDEIWEAAEETA